MGSRRVELKNNTGEKSDLVLWVANRPNLLYLVSTRLIWKNRIDILLVLSPNKKIEFKGAPALNIIGIGQNEKKNDQSGSQEPQSKEIGGNGGYIPVNQLLLRSEIYS